MLCKKHLCDLGALCGEFPAFYPLELPQWGVKDG
jgi:hypothetical protein